MRVPLEALIGPFTLLHNIILNYGKENVNILSLFGALIICWQAPQNWLPNTWQKTLINVIYFYMYSAERRSSVVTQFGSEKPSPGSVCLEYFFLWKHSLSGVRNSEQQYIMRSHDLPRRYMIWFLSCDIPVPVRLERNWIVELLKHIFFCCLCASHLALMNCLFTATLSLL